MTSVLFALVAAYLGVGGLLVHDTELPAHPRTWRAQVRLFVLSIGLALQWPRYAWRIVRGLD